MKNPAADGREIGDVTKDSPTAMRNNLNTVFND